MPTKKPRKRPHILDTGILQAMELADSTSNAWNQHLQLDPMTWPEHLAVVAKNCTIEEFTDEVREWLGRSHEAVRHDDEALALFGREAVTAQGLIMALRALGERLGDTPEFRLVAMLAYELGKTAQKASIRRMEKPARQGRLALCQWRGRWFRVTELERRILKTVGNENCIDYERFARHVWNFSASHKRTERGKVDTALSKLSNKIAPLTMHIRGEHVIVE